MQASDCFFSENKIINLLYKIWLPGIHANVRDQNQTFGDEASRSNPYKDSDVVFVKPLQACILVPSDAIRIR